MLLASDWRLNGVATLPISSLTPVRKNTPGLNATMLTAPVTPRRVDELHAPATPREFDPVPRSKATYNDPALPLITHVPAVSPGIVMTIFAQIFAVREKENGYDLVPAELVDRAAIRSRLIDIEPKRQSNWLRVGGSPREVANRVTLNRLLKNKCVRRCGSNGGACRKSEIIREADRPRTCSDIAPPCSVSRR